MSMTIPHSQSFSFSERYRLKPSERPKVEGLWAPSWDALLGLCHGVQFRDLRSKAGAAQYLGSRVIRHVPDELHLTYTPVKQRPSISHDL